MKRKNIEQGILTNIFQLSNNIQSEGDKLTDELTLKQWLLLFFLYKGAIENPTVNDIALAMGVTRQSAKKMITILEKGEYLSVDKSSSDSRALCIRPTSKARDFFVKNKSLGKVLLNKVFMGINDEELSVAFQVLRIMQTNLNGAHEDGK